EGPGGARQRREFPALLHAADCQRVDQGLTRARMTLANRALSAGTGRADITPPVGIAHVNWGARVHDRAEGVDLPFHATALLLDDGEASAAIIDLDILLIPTADCARLRAIAAEAAGLPPENVRLSFRHTHAGAPWSETRGGAQAG